MQNVRTYLNELDSYNLQLHLQLQETRRYSEIIAYLGRTSGLSESTVVESLSSDDSWLGGICNGRF